MCDVSCVMCDVSCVICHVSCVMFHVSNVTSQMSNVTCHLSPAPTATATDPPPDNYPTMHSRLVHQDRTQKPKHISKPKKSLKLWKKGLGFAISAIRYSTRSLQSMRFWSPTERTNKQTDIATFRLNAIHLRFKQAQLKMYQSPKVKDGVENYFFISWTHIFGI